MKQKTPILIGFSYLFLVMACYYILKPVRESFFLGEQGYQGLPIAHLLVLTATFLTVMVYSWAARRLGPARLIFVANVFFLISIGIFWVVLTQVSDQPNIRSGMAWVYYCWVSVFAVFAVTLFWSVVHTIFTSRGGSKSYGVIGAGATLGAMVGGFLTQRLAERLGTENLLLVAAALLSPCLWLGWSLAKYSKTQSSLAVDGEEESEENFAAGSELKASKDDALPASYRSAFQIFQQSPYLCGLGTIVFLTIFISVFDEYRYGKIISEAFPRDAEVVSQIELVQIDPEIETQLNVQAPETNTGNSRTAFFGKIYFYTNLIGLFFSLVLTGPVQSRFGPAPGMILYTLAIVGTGLALLWNPTLPVVFWSAVCVQSIAYSIFQWSRELLYTVTTAEEKFVAKGVIDTFLFRAGAAGAALTLLVAASIGVTDSSPDGILTQAPRQMSYVTIPVAILMMGLIVWLARGYRLKVASEEEQ